MRRCQLRWVTNQASKMSSVSSARGKRVDPLSKRVPENPKFKHVRPTIDTGASMTRHLEKLEEMKRDYKFRKDEIFKRMKVTTFVQLVIQVADVDAMVEDSYASNGAGDYESSSRPDTADLEVQKIQTAGRGVTEPGPESGEVPSSRADTSRSKLEEVICGVGEADLDDNSGSSSRPVVNTSNCPYLLLDIREKDAYDECHIITAQSYPTAMLARSVNYESKDMLRYKNQDGKIIIMYDYDETLAHRAATTLVQRGYDNLFILSGGLKVAYKIFPEGLITGTVPEAGGCRAGSKTKAASQSQPADKKDFTISDLDSLVTYMDSALGDNSSGSRMSQQPKGGGASRMSTISSTSRAPCGRPAFKP